jgi:ABC-2 type transport system permease protein
MIDSVKEQAISAVRNRSSEFQQEFDATIREAQESMDAELKSLPDEIESCVARVRTAASPRPCCKRNSRGSRSNRRPSNGR